MGNSIAVLLLALAACSPFGGGTTFSCATDTECSTAGTAGRCEKSTGFCAFADPVCSSGMRYGDLAGSLSNTCVGDTGPDGGMPDARPDSPPGLSCYGTGYVSACFMTPPSGSMSVSATIDTDTSSMCSNLVVNSTAWCVIAAGDLTVQDINASGSRPLVLLATGTLTVSGPIDVASHRPGVSLNPGQVGAGSVPPANTTLCDAGTAPGANGGGAGGSFVTAGANGGAPHPGIAGGIKTVAALRGGCAGQDGKSGTPGVGGPGGGAVYLFAGTQIIITSTINASGAAGTGANQNNGGGGGGGAGGMIALDAPTVSNAGILFANGGGGGEGSGNSTPGFDGNEPSGVGAAQKTGSNVSIGGDGGSGAAAGSDPTAGATGSASGGGGGGGVGVIKLFQITSLAGQASPTPTP